MHHPVFKLSFFAIVEGANSSAQSDVDIVLAKGGHGLQA
jgi:hypothetical protein